MEKEKEKNMDANEIRKGIKYDALIKSGNNVKRSV